MVFCPLRCDGKVILVLVFFFFCFCYQGQEKLREIHRGLTGKSRADSERFLLSVFYISRI